MSKSAASQPALAPGTRRKLVFYNPWGHIESEQQRLFDRDDGGYVIQVQNVPRVLPEFPDEESDLDPAPAGGAGTGTAGRERYREPKTVRPAEDVANNPTNSQYLAFPPGFKRRTAFIEEDCNVELTLLKKISTDTVYINPDKDLNELPINVATGCGSPCRKDHLGREQDVNTKFAFPTANVELAMSMLKKRRDGEPGSPPGRGGAPSLAGGLAGGSGGGAASLGAAEVSERRAYAAKHQLAEIFERLFEELLTHRPENPKHHLATALYRGHERDKLEEELALVQAGLPW